MTAKDEQINSDKLLMQINVAVEAVNTAQGEVVSRSKEVGLLLLEAKKLQPKVKDFHAFLKRVNGLRLSRAYDMMKLAGGRTTDEELKKDARERQQKSRKKKPKAEPFRDATEKTDAVPKPTPLEPSGNDTEASTEKQKQVMAAIAAPTANERATKTSAHYLSELRSACHSYLPKITVEADRQKARQALNSGAALTPRFTTSPEVPTAPLRRRSVS